MNEMSWIYRVPVTDDYKVVRLKDHNEHKIVVVYRYKGVQFKVTWFKKEVMLLEEMEQNEAELVIGKKLAECCRNELYEIYKRI